MAATIITDCAVWLPAPVHSKTDTDGGGTSPTSSKCDWRLKKKGTGRAQIPIFPALFFFFRSRWKDSHYKLGPSSLNVHVTWPDARGQRKMVASWICSWTAGGSNKTLITSHSCRVLISGKSKSAPQNQQNFPVIFYKNFEVVSAKGCR